MTTNRNVATSAILRAVLVLNLCFVCAVGWAQAQWSPDRPVEIVVGASPGGGTDITARVIQRILKDQGLVENSVVVNRPGGSHTIAWAYLNQHTGNGHFISIVNEPFVTNRLIGASKLGFRDFTPLTVLFSEYMVFVVRPDSSIKNGADLLARLKADPTALSIGFASAPGNNSHLSIGLAAKAAGVDLKQLKTVIFKSGGESLTALLGGHVDVGVNPAATAITHIGAGRLRVLAVTSPGRLSGPLADIPTWKEQGANFTYGSWRVAFGTRELGQPQIAFWEESFKRLLDSDAWKQELIKRHQETRFHSAADTRKFLEAEESRLRPVVQELGLVRK
ncbi:MAG: tripartite tricarboxylate transporter substrate binding protein [Betaproteobacteria bacterium]|nr:tripartite tricarboxylate transporter substrate binding protein [Betaproteobacteria bacterium]